jgi:hydroxymethylglutaryl-CoA lyase
VHLHNTRGLGLANALAALEEGITTLDSSLGGLAAAPTLGRSGNIVTNGLHARGDGAAHRLTSKAPQGAGGRRGRLPNEQMYGFTPMCVARRSGIAPAVGVGRGFSQTAR